MTKDHSDTRILDLAKPSVAVQIIAILGFTGFAIPISIIAMAQFGMLGLVLAAFLAWQWTRLVGLGSERRLAEAVTLLRPQLAEKPRSSGNTSFDSYRVELMARLEQEQSNFEGFLSRLRDAKDKSEFDNFMIQREKNARNTLEAATA